MELALALPHEREPAVYLSRQPEKTVLYRALAHDDGGGRPARGREAHQLEPTGFVGAIGKIRRPTLRRLVKLYGTKRRVRNEPHAGGTCYDPARRWNRPPLQPDNTSGDGPSDVVRQNSQNISTGSCKMLTHVRAAQLEESSFLTAQPWFSRNLAQNDDTAYGHTALTPYSEPCGVRHSCGGCTGPHLEGRDDRESRLR